MVFLKSTQKPISINDLSLSIWGYENADWYILNGCPLGENLALWNCQFNGFFNGKTSRIIIMENAFSCLYRCFGLMIIGFRTIMRNASRKTSFFLRYGIPTINLTFCSLKSIIIRRLNAPVVELVYTAGWGPVP